MICIDNPWRTLLPVSADREFMLSADEKVLLLGSCFTDNIGARMSDAGLNVCVNPGGVQYNPASIAALIRAAISGQIPPQTIFSSEGRTRCWLLPTRFSSADADEAVQIVQQSLDMLKDALLSADTLIVTLGTAWIYSHIPSPLSAYGQVVGNCHKVPAREFERRCMEVSEIVELWTALLRELAEVRGRELKLIFTVSPIRHFKDGAHGNTLSKSTLHLAVSQLTGILPQSRYFPAYELLIDDLRDYRFYADDMLHPSALAVDYIWKHFLYTFYNDSDRAQIACRAKALRASRHRPLLPS